MARPIGENAYEDWDEVVQMACVLAPRNSEHQFHEGHAWMELFFDLAGFPKGEQLVQMEALRREIAALYSWIWGDPSDDLLIIFDCESGADRAHQLHRAGVIAYMGLIGHLPGLPRADSESGAPLTDDQSPKTKKWLKDCCNRVKNTAFFARDRVLYEHYDVTEFHLAGKNAFPFFAEAGLYATAVGLESVPEHARLLEAAVSDPVKQGDPLMQAAFEVFLVMLSDEAFPIAAYELDLGLFDGAEQAFRDSVEIPPGVTLSVPTQSGDPEK